MSSGWKFLLVGIVAFLSVLSYPVYLWVRWCRSKQRWREIKDVMGFRESTSYRLEGDWNHRDVSIHYEPGHRYEFSSIRVHLPGSYSHLPSATIRRERWWDQLGKGTGLSEELQAELDRFDRNIYLETDDERFMSILQDGSFQDRILKSIPSRHVSVQITPRGLDWTIKSHPGFWKEFTPAYLKDVLDTLCTLDEILCRKNSQMEDRTVTRESRAADSGSTLLAVLTYTPSMVSVMAGFVLLIWGMYYPTLTLRLQWLGLKVAGALFTLYCPIVYLQVRGQSRGHKRFLHFVVAALFGFPMLFVGGLQASNGFLDSNRTHWEQGRVVDHEYDDGDYRVEVTLRHDGVEGHPELTVEQKIYDRLQENSPVLVKIHEGFWDEPWAGELRLDR